MRNEVQQRSCSFTPLWCLGTIVSPSIAQMRTNFSQVCTTTCQMVLASYALPNWFENFENYMKKLKFRLPFVKHLPKCILHKQEMNIVGICYTTMWPQNTICNFQKVHALITNFGQPYIVCRPNLQKIIKNSKLIKIFWNLHQWNPCVK